MTPPLLETTRSGPLPSAVLALREWTARQYAAAALFAAGFAVLIGVPTVLIPNPVFSREIAVVGWNYPVWIATSVLSGMLAATYLRADRRQADTAETSEAAGESRTSRLGIAGGVLTWFAVGCPVCNKVALLVLGYSGAITWFAPFQPVLAVAALALTAGALVVRLRGQVACPLPAPRQTTDA
jgi:hypothetical protein